MRHDLSPGQKGVLMHCAQREDGRVTVELLVKNTASVGQSLTVARSSTSRRIHRLASRGFLRLEPRRRAKVVELTSAGWDVVAETIINGNTLPPTNTRINGNKQTSKPVPLWRRLFRSFGGDER